jgi:hypothetical protein
MRAMMRRDAHESLTPANTGATRRRRTGVTGPGASDASRLERLGGNGVLARADEVDQSLCPRDGAVEVV